MSTPKRYKQPGMMPYPNGEWVSWEDHAPLLAETERLRAENARYVETIRQLMEG